MPTSTQIAAHRAYEQQARLKPLAVRGKATPKWHGWLMLIAVFVAVAYVAFVAGRTF